MNPDEPIRIDLLGGFAVTIGDRSVPDAAWRRRHAAALVKLLALRPERRLHREQVLDLIWPDDPIATASGKLHKAAHYARKATGRADTIVLGGDLVQLFPDVPVVVDAIAFEVDATAAVAGGDAALGTAAAARYRGELLPDDPYEEWALPAREHLRGLFIGLLGLLERWPEVIAVDPGNELAHLALMRRHVAAGDRYAALRQFDRLDRVLRDELGLHPGREAVRLRDQLLQHDAAPGDPALRSIGREPELAILERALDETMLGRAQVVWISGPAGIGKSELLAAITDRAGRLGWRTGTGTAAIEGAWPYAPVLQVVGDICRRQPAILDGLADPYREEIDRVLAGAPASWGGESTHQRLFVAVAELLRLASATNGVVVAVDDLHRADDASLRLVHYLSRALADARVLVVVTHRSDASTGAAFDDLRVGMTERGGHSIVLGALSDDAIRRLVRDSAPDIAEPQLDRIQVLAGGNPFLALALAQRAGDTPTWAADLGAIAVAGMPAAVREPLQHVAVAGSTFDTDEFVALSGLDDEDAYDRLDESLSLRIIEPGVSGYRFRDQVVRDALLADVAPHRIRMIHRNAADRLAALGASPARVGHHLVEAGETRRAVPHLLAAAETEASIGAYHDALTLVDTARTGATGDDLARLALLRADLLMALGDGRSVNAYREALEHASAVDRRRVLARLARAAMMTGDIETAEMALEGVEPDGGPDDGELLLAQGHAAFFTSNFPKAAAIAEEARRRVLAGDKSWQVLDLMSLQGLLAHQRGEWFDRMRTELSRQREAPEVANAVFDGYLCTAEFLLYGPTPYDDVIRTATELRATALRSGALRAVAFATALIGEAALLSGDLDVAVSELEEAVELHHDLDSSAGEALSLQRLAEARLLTGDATTARLLLDRALPLARWSFLAHHLLHRIYGTMIQAAAAPDLARATVDQAELTLGTDDVCAFCSIMIAIPSVVACADVGDLDDAHRHLQRAKDLAARWEDTSFDASIAEAEGRVALAEGDPGRGAELLDLAARRFERAGQPLDVQRCRQRLAALAS